MQTEELISVFSKLEEMSLNELRDFWQERFHTRAPGLSRHFLRKRIAFLLQEQNYGGYSDFVRTQVLHIASQEPITLNSKGFEVGKVFSRVWQGTLYRIVAVENGFRMNGKLYRSLSGAAFAITGTQWSGKVFWRIK